MTFRYLVIGAGVVGLAIARRLSQDHRDDNDVLVIEQERTFGQGVSSRNSEVIHSGIYYPTSSLKHRLCIEGRRMLYQYCADKAVPHRKCGKLIVATDASEEPSLARLLEQARSNDVENVTQISRQQAMQMEPGLSVHSALLSGETGIIDTHALMKSLESEINSNTGTISYGSAVVAIEHAADRYRVRLGDGEEVECHCLVNAAGLGAVEISAMLGIKNERLYPCKGVYFAYSGKHSVTHLVYPLPEHNLASLGVHATIDLAGRLRFGPDVEYPDRIGDYSVSEDKREAFYVSASKLFPAIERDRLYPEMAAFRPRIQSPTEKSVKDFYIREETDNGCPWFINLLGIESPGLTSCLAIAEHVAELAAA